MEAALDTPLVQEDIASIGATVQMVRPRRLIDLIVIGSSYPSLPHFRESIITMKSLMRMIPLSIIPESGKGRGESASSAVIGGATISLVLCNCVPRFRN
jgi:hypothetical protein